MKSHQFVFDSRHMGAVLIRDMRAVLGRCEPSHFLDAVGHRLPGSPTATGLSKPELALTAPVRLGILVTTCMLLCNVHIVANAQTLCRCTLMALGTPAG